MRKFTRLTSKLCIITLLFSPIVEAKDEYQLPTLVNSIDETSLSNPSYVLGQHYFRKLHGSKGFINYPPAYNYLRNEISKLLPYTQLYQKKIELALLNSEQSNAFVIPGNHLFIYSEIMSMIDSEEKLLALLAHELAHLDLHHYERRVQNASEEGGKSLLLIGAGLAAALAGADSDTTAAFWIGGMANQQVNMLSNSREQEQEADKQGRNYLIQAGIDPKAMSELFLAFFQASMGTQSLEFLSTHPIPESRFAESIQGVSKNDDYPYQGDPEAFQDFRASLIAYRMALMNNPSNIILSGIKDPSRQKYALALVALLKNNLDEAKKFLPDLDENNASQAYLKANILLAIGANAEANKLIQKKLTINPNNLMYLNLIQDYSALNQFSYFDSSLLQYEKDMVVDMQLEKAKKDKNLPLTLAYQALEDFSKGKSMPAKQSLERAKKLATPEELKKIKPIDNWFNQVKEAEEANDIEDE